MDEPTTTTTDDGTGDSDGMRNLRDAHDREKQRADTNEGAARELAFVKAGVDTDSALGNMFMRAYDGELTKEAIEVAAGEVGALRSATPPAPTGDELPPGPGESTTRQALISGDAPPPTPKEKAPTMDDAWAERQRLLSAGAEDDEAASPVFGHILSQAAAGNPAFLVDDAAWQEEGRRATIREREAQGASAPVVTGG
jgi:hypothetical protein